MTEGVKLFRKDEAQFKRGPNGIAAQGLINAGFSKQLGAGVGVFDKCRVEWTLEYDEVLFIIDGRLRLHVSEKIYEAEAGDVLPPERPLSTRLRFGRHSSMLFLRWGTPSRQKPGISRKPAQHFLRKWVP